MHHAVTRESIERATSLFWEQMLGMPMRAIDENPELADPSTLPGSRLQARCIGTEHLVGSCDLSGAWRGRIEIRLSQSLALEATAAMLMQPPASIEDGDRLDATREIANMIAGTMKSALPRPCSMSVPSAEVASADFCMVPRTEDSVTVFFCHSAGEMMVRVWQEMEVGERLSAAMPENRLEFRPEPQRGQEGWPAVEELVPLAAAS